MGIQTDTIIVGDCIERLKQLPDNSVDLIFADPPYFMQTEGALLRTDGTVFAGVDDHWDKFSDFAHYDEFSTAWLSECRRILKPTGSIWVIGSFQNIYRLGYIMQNLGYWILNDVIWSKPNAVPNFSGTRFQNSHETLLWCAKDKQSKFVFNYKTMKHLNGGRQDKSVWNIGICIGSERIKNSEGKKAHNTQKPEALLYKVIASSTKPGDLVLDPFLGTGTTAAVAKSLGRHYLGIERELEYAALAEARVSEIVFTPDEISELTYEVKPPRVPMVALVESGLLLVGQSLYDKNGIPQCTVLHDGTVTDGSAPVSIHKMSAQRLGRTNNNGWDYFYYMAGDTLCSINDLRQEYSKGRKP